MRSILTFCICLLFCTLLSAQNEATRATSFWNSRSINQVAEQEFSIVPEQYYLYSLELEALKNKLEEAPIRSANNDEGSVVVLEIPVGENNMEQFRFVETPVMESRLQAKYPNIRTYTATGIDDPGKLIKLEVGPQGIKAMIFSPDGNMIIMPVNNDDSSTYMLFRKSDVHDEAHNFHCELDDFSSNPVSDRSLTSLNPTGTELRTYRLALGATGEYTSYHGGTKELALAAIATSLNRVNGIYERDFTITMVLVNNTDTLIYLDPDTDPYTNNDLGAILGENQLLCDSLIGFDNYDIGHVYGTAGGGLAGLGVVCGGVKAWGATGLGNPIGDVFDVDYVSHEIGHQFGAGHTFNNCGSQAGQAYEPGSGVTIMAYAGLCGSNNLQPNSIDQFHVASYDQVIAYSQSANGNSCPTITETGNTPPTVDVGEGGFYIPYNTPFELTGSASDIDGDSLTYCWEQFDLGPLTSPDVALGTAPLFRSWSPVNTPTRIFPRIEDLVTNTSTIGELLPQFGREMNFRMTVRDNSPGGGGVDYDQITFQVADSSGNFRILAPNAGQIWIAGSLQTVAWDVASSDQFPVNCSNVNIWMSEDGGYTYPHLVAANRQNNGSAIITVPNLVGNQIRIKVKAADNIFFDVSNGDNIIVAASTPDFLINLDNPADTICGMGMATFEINLDTIAGYAANVQLEVIAPITGVTFAFSDNDVTPPASVILTVTNEMNIFPGDYTFTLQATGDGIVKNLPLTLRIRDEAPQQVSLVAPFNGSTNVPESAIFSWNPIPFATTYTVEVSDSPAFDELIYSATEVSETTYDPSPDLLPNSVYFWRAKVEDSACGPGDWSNTFSFQTERSQCVLYGSESVGVSISPSGTPTVYSEIEVTQDYPITDLDVLNLVGTHTWVGDLRMTLISPINDSTLLFGNICGDQDDWNLNFDDDATETEIPCPPTSGLTYQPIEPLSLFNGSSPLGVWRLKIEDTANQDGGELQNWNLRICGPAIDDMPATINIAEDSVLLGAVLFIDNSHLMGECSGSSSDADYQITSLPTYGNLYLNGEPMVIGSTFTQDDINNLLLTYEHQGTDETPDQFSFILTCDNGSYIGGLVYDITVLDPVNTAEVDNRNYWNVFPNPTNGMFTLQTSFPDASAKRVQVIDLLGRVVLEQSFGNSARKQLDISAFASGMYTCRLLTEDNQTLGSRKIILAK